MLSEEEKEFVYSAVINEIEFRRDTCTSNEELGMAEVLAGEILRKLEIQQNYVA